jgi:hypothetical protein
MLSKCANPACNTPFRRLRTGRLFQFELEGGKGTGAELAGRYGEALCIYRSPEEGGVRSIERFWLCAGCAGHWSLVRSPRADGVLLVSLPERQQRCAAAS